MRQRILLFLFLALLIAALIALNAVSYSQKDQEPDSEFFPNRSSYNSGATGTSAFYDLLSETGNKVTRWQQPPSALISPNSKISTLVIIGETRREVSEDDAKKILMWVNLGGRLVLIDRSPAPELLSLENNWAISLNPSEYSFTYDETENPMSLIEKIPAAKPVQPTTLMTGINAVQPSKLAAKLFIRFVEAPEKAISVSNAQAGSAPPPRVATPAPLKTPMSSPSASPPAILTEKSGKTNSAPTFSPTPYTHTQKPFDGYAIGDQPDKSEEDPTAPVVHLSNPDKEILVDIPYGSGRIVVLSDPYIVSNAGIKLVDNAVLGLNLASTNGGTIAFDEYHQGFGSENTFLRYFSGTPVLAIFGQVVLLVLVVLWTQGRRFARPLPLPAKDRRSKLEYIAAMADLQQSSRAYDLAIENVYTQVKRDLIRMVGADNTIQKKALAEAVSERSGYEAKDLYVLMSKCEDIIHGEPTNAKETMNLISQLRALEERLGFSRTKTSKMKQR